MQPNLGDIPPSIATDTEILAGLIDRPAKEKLISASGPTRSVPKNDATKLQASQPEAPTRVSRIRVSATLLTLNNTTGKAEIWQRFLSVPSLQNTHDIKYEKIVSEARNQSLEDAEFVLLDSTGVEIPRSDFEKLDDYMDACTCKAFVSEVQKERKW